MAIGVFGLQVAYKLKRAELLSADDTHGWIGGGFNTGPTSISTVDRIDFSNDDTTASIRNPLSLAKYYLAATGNTNYGWFGGGTPGTISSVDRIDFSNDLSNASSRGQLSVGRFGLAATGNSNYGWYGGGLTPSALSAVDRVDYSNDSSISSPRGPLSLARGYVAATGNSTYGWWGGGYAPGPSIYSTIDRVDFSNDSVSASPRSILTLARYGLAATGNSNYGWYGGGNTGANSSRVDRIDFSNDSSCLVRGTVNSRQDYAATGNSNYGWWTGGSTISSIILRIDFSNDLVSVVGLGRGSTSTLKRGSGATSGQAKINSIKPQKTGSYGWWGGGYDGAFTTSQVYRVNFSNDLTGSSLRGPLNSARQNLSATGNTNYGWFNNNTSITVDRIDFLNDSVAALIRGQLSDLGVTRASLSATSNSNYGWFGGGSPGGPTPLYSFVNRVNFSNDLLTASLRGSLSEARRNLAATGNSNYGWFSGGRAPSLGVATVDRIDYSNDLTRASPRGPLNSPRYAHGATGNSDYGWFGGGAPSPPAAFERINFSNDLVSPLNRQPGLGNVIGTAAGNNNYGWFDFTYGTTYRLDFSNDSLLATRGPLTSATYRAATSNTPVG